MALFGPPDVAKLKDKRDVKGLIKALGYRKDTAIRSGAARALGELGDQRAGPGLVDALWDPKPGVRLAAAEALATMANPGAYYPFTHIVASEHYDDLVRAAAARALGETGDAGAIPALVTALRYFPASGSDVFVDQLHQAAAEALGKIGHPRADRALSRARWYGDDGVRRAAARALARIERGRDLGRAIAALKDEDEFGREGAARQLGASGDALAVKPLIAALADSSAEVRKAAAEALAWIGWAPDRGPAGAAYWAALGRWDRCAECGTVGAEALATALSSWDLEMRKKVARALGRMGNPRAIPALVAMLDDEYVTARRSAAAALAGIGKACVPYLRVALRHKHGRARASAAEALGSIGDPDAVEALIEALKDEDPDVCRWAAWALGRIGDRRAVEPLTAVSQYAEKNLRANAAQALRKIRHNPPAGA
jgi:HEAT repeat protein